MQIFHPDQYIRSYKSLDIPRLQEQGIKLLLCDIDNTLVAFDDPHSNEDVRQFMQALEAAGIKPALMSNNFKSRAKRFSKNLGVEKIYSFSLKPLPFTYWRAMLEHHVKRSETAILGDQLFTDILGGSIAGITTILTAPVVDRERPDTRFMRLLEKFLYRYYEKKNIMKRGDFDD